MSINYKEISQTLNSPKRIALETDLEKYETLLAFINTYNKKGCAFSASKDFLKHAVMKQWIWILLTKGKVSEKIAHELNNIITSAYLIEDRDFSNGKHKIKTIKNSQREHMLKNIRTWIDVIHARANGGKYEDVLSQIALKEQSFNIEGSISPKSVEKRFNSTQRFFKELKNFNIDHLLFLQILGTSNLTEIPD